MTSLELLSEQLARIADALDRLAPPPRQDADLLACPAYVWTGNSIHGITRISAPCLEDFRGIDNQRATLLENCRRFAMGLPAHDSLLWGARGMGKSSLVRAIHATLRADGHDLALIQLFRDDITTLAPLLRRLADIDRRYLIFIDDLSFDGDEAAIRALRSLLEGGVEARPDNVRLIVTSNRRHLVPRSLAENEAAAAVNPRDVLDDKLALADRFGLSLGFHACDQDTYLAIVHAYGVRHHLAIDDADALEWAMTRGSRSGRVAWQYIQEVAGSAGKGLN